LPTRIELGREAPSGRRVHRSIGGCAAALLLGFACATGGIPVRSGHLVYLECDEAQQRAIATAYDRAAWLADRAALAIDDPDKQELARDDGWPQYGWWFGAYSDERYATVRDVLRATGAEFERDYEMRCGTQTPNCPPPTPEPERSGRDADRDDFGPDFEEDWGQERMWKVFAFANADIRSLQVCEDFFHESPRERAAVVFHEITHVVRDTEDHVYRERSVLALARDRPDRAVRNAPNYQGFVTSVASGRVPGESQERGDED
jgi:hypothetical protein